MSMPFTDRPFWVAWSRIRGVGPHRIKRLAHQFASLQEAWFADHQQLMRVEGIGSQVAETIGRERQKLDPEHLLQQILAKGIPVLTPADPDYPALLWELPDPPPLLYVLGESPQWTPTVAIVGTRAPTSYGRRWTEKVSTALTEAGFVIVSGLAAGVDGVAHQACLKAGGHTIAVLGTGVDQVYPSHHRDLYRQIRAQGTLVSEFPPGTLPAKENFPRRNRVIAGLCSATLVMEAPERSGALITAYLANDYNRDVYALPGNIDVEESRGCLKLIRAGAAMIVSIDDLLADLGANPSLSRFSSSREDQGEPTSSAPAHMDLEGDQGLIWRALSHDPMSLDAIAQLTQLEINTLSSTLLIMELEGWVVQVSGMRYQKVRKNRGS